MSRAIRLIQAQLKVDGYDIAVDGLYGKNTDKAIKQAVTNGTHELYFDFDKYKKLFKVKRLKQSFIDNINTLYDTFNNYNKEGGTNPLYIAYMLATTKHETANTFRPIRERGSYKYLSKYDTGRLARVLGNTPQADGDGQFYAGRGYVQITGRANYSKFSKLLGIDLVTRPDLALQAPVAAQILVIGSLRGLFTGKGLEDYIRAGSYTEFKEARRVINGTNEAGRIADYAVKFLECVTLIKV